MCCELPKLEAGILDNNEFIAANTISSPPIRNGPIQTSVENNQCQYFCNEFVCILFPTPSRYRRDTKCNRIQITIRSNIYWPVINLESVSVVNGAWWLHLCQSYGIMAAGGWRAHFYDFQNHFNNCKALST